MICERLSTGYEQMATISSDAEIQIGRKEPEPEHYFSTTKTIDILAEIVGIDADIHYIHHFI